MKPKDGGGVTIVKRKKIIAAPHHGGAWKVAYADFVTAMMAFFLLMWLLNATSEDQRKGLAEYFDPKIPISRVSAGGSGMFGGHDIFSEDTSAQSGTGASARLPTRELQARGDMGTEGEPVERDGRTPGDSDGDDGVEAARRELDTLFQGLSGESDVENELLRHVRVRITDEGLVIELFDADGRPLFELGSAQPTPRMRTLLEMVGQAISLVVNDVAVDGHTDSLPFSRPGYGNWELSSDRAHAARRALTGAGVDPDRMARVVGKADRDPAEPDNPADPRNRRVTITLLRHAP